MADVIVRDEGSLVLLTPQNEVSEQWFTDHVSRDDDQFQPIWPTVLVEPRYVDDILHALLDEGFEVGV